MTQFRSVLARSPFLVFFGALILLFVIIAGARLAREPADKKSEHSEEPRTVSAFFVGTTSPMTTTSALVKKESIQPIVALIAGTVEHISVRPGMQVSATTPLLRLSADYGANRAGIETALAKENQRFTEDMNRLDRNILALEKKAARHDDTLDDTNEALALQRLKRDRATLQESLVTQALSVDLSRAEAAVFEPRAFTRATVEYIPVHPGDFVTPGTVLALLRTENGATTLETTLDPALAQAFDPTTPAELSLSQETSFRLLPSSFAPSETPDGLFVIRYLLSPDISRQVTGGTRVTLRIPLRAPAGKTLVPLDTLFTHTDHTSLFILTEGRAEERTVTVEKIFGSTALISDTFPHDTAILLDRDLIAGEPLTLSRVSP